MGQGAQLNLFGFRIEWDKVYMVRFDNFSFFFEQRRVRNGAKEGQADPSNQLQQVREELVRKKDDLTRISGPIFERVDQAYRRLEQVHGRQGECNGGGQK